VADDSTAAVPAPAPSSLSPDAQETKAQIEGWIGDRSSPYYNGNGELTADNIQNHYRDLVRGELHGQAEAMEEPHAPDLDLPLHAGAYDIASIPGAATIGALERGIIDNFLPVAFANGLGQRKAADAIGFVLSGGGTPEQFKFFAHGRGFSERAIDAVLSWYSKFTNGAAAPHSERTPALQASDPSARMRAIEAEMFFGNGIPGPYWNNPAMQAEYRALIEGGAR